MQLLYQGLFCNFFGRDERKQQRGSGRGVSEMLELNRLRFIVRKTKVVLAVVVLLCSVLSTNLVAARSPIILE